MSWPAGSRAAEVCGIDIVDLYAVAEPEAIELAAPFLGKHGAAFLQRLHERAEFVEEEFNAVDTIGFQRPFAQCLAQAHSIIEPILGNRVHNSHDIIMIP